MTMRDPYQMLNDCQTECEEAPLNDMEKNRLLRSVTGTKPKKKHRALKVMAAVAVAAGLILAAGQLPFGQRAFADASFRISQMKYSMAQAMGRDDSVNNYAQSIGQQVKIGDWTMQLNAIAMDGENFLVNGLLESPDPNIKMEECEMLDLRHLMVNGRPVKVLGGGGSLGPVAGEPGVFSSVVSYQLAEPLPKSGVVHLTLDFAPPYLITTDVARFDIDVDMDKLNKDRRIHELNLHVDEGFVLKNMNFGPVGQFFTLQKADAGEEAQNVYTLVGSDDQGRHIVFEERQGGIESNGIFSAQMALSELQSDLTPEALLDESKTLTLQLYRTPMPKESGRMSNERIPIGQPVTVDLHPSA